MQPVTHAKRSILAMMTLSAAVIVTATLLLTLRVVAANTSSNSTNTADSSPPVRQMVSSDSGIARAPKGDNSSTSHDNKNKVIGPVVAVAPGSDFSGTWQILESGTVVTVVVTPETEVKYFDGILPITGTWVEAKGRPQDDGTLLARKFRPNKFESSEVVARLAVTAVLTDVLNVYQTIQLTPIEPLLSSASIYRFAIGEDEDELSVAAAMQNDSANFMWAEVNFVSEIPFGPIGNPYRSWKWGSNESSGYISHNAFVQINLAPVQQRYSGAGVTVAVLDTGIDATHPVFAHNLLPGRDFVSEDYVPQDGPEAGQAGGTAEGHGTHVSGVIAHIAPESMILPIRVLNVDGRGNNFKLAYAIDWAVANGAHVINMSLGSDCDSHLLEESILYALNQGVVIVASAGNDNEETPQCPAAYPGVLAITAVDDDRHKADFANYGTGWVDLAAPGVGITSTVPVSGEILYGTWSGTSMATPFAAGAAALLREYLPTAGPEEIGDRLIHTGSDLDMSNQDYIGKLGRLLNIGAALKPEELFLPALSRGP